MRAIRVHEVGGPDVMRVENIADPQPGDGEALVRIEAIGLNFIDVYFRRGRERIAWCTCRMGSLRETGQRRCCKG